MKTYSEKDEIVIGRDVGGEIMRKIKGAEKSIKIVSPYLSPSYLEELVKLRKRGIQITLITSDNLESNQTYSKFKHSDVIKRRKILNEDKKTDQKNLFNSLWFMVISIFLLILTPIFSSLFYLSIILLLIGGGGMIYSFYAKPREAYEYYSIFKLRVFDSKSGKNPGSTNLVHSKIFIIDDKIAFLGSANFTYSGFKTHYETVIKIKDQNAIKDISLEVENLFNSKELAYKSIDEWGREIYEKGFFPHSQHF